MNSFYKCILWIFGNTIINTSLFHHVILCQPIYSRKFQKTVEMGAWGWATIDNILGFFFSVILLGLFHYIMLSMTFLSQANCRQTVRNLELMWKPPIFHHGTWLMAHNYSRSIKVFGYSCYINDRSTTGARLFSSIHLLSEISLWLNIAVRSQKRPP